jgi:hypothetical protein
VKIMITERAVVRAGARGPLAISLAGLFAAAMVLSVAPTAQAEETVEQQIEKSILLVGTTYSGYVLVPYDDGDEWEQVEATSLCTGWFASPDGHIVTAGHCVDPQEGRSALLQQLLAELGQPELYEDAYANWTVEGEADGSEVERTVQVIQPGDVEGAAITGDPLTAQVVDFQSFDDGDVALLRVAGMSDTPALAIAEENPVVGQELTAIGFPGSVSSVVDGARIRASVFQVGYRVEPAGQYVGGGRHRGDRRHQPGHVGRTDRGSAGQRLRREQLPDHRRAAELQLHHRHRQPAVLPDEQQRAVHRRGDRGHRR